MIHGQKRGKTEIVRALGHRSWSRPRRFVIWLSVAALSFQFQLCAAATICFTLLITTRKGNTMVISIGTIHACESISTPHYDAMFHSCHKLFHIICWDNVQFHTSNITCSAVIQVLPRSLGKLSSSMQCDSSMPPLLLYWVQSSSKVQDARIKCRMYFHFLFYQLMMKIRHVNKHTLK